MYAGSRAKVVTPDGNSEEFDILAGVLQGDTLAPFLFVIVLDFALRKAISGREHETTVLHRPLHCIYKSLYGIQTLYDI